jgi:hypothetical protein
MTIEASDRASHQLVSRILKILLHEVLGYDEVEIRSGFGFNSMNTTQTLNRLARCNDEGYVGGWADAMPRTRPGPLRAALQLPAQDSAANGHSNVCTECLSMCGAGRPGPPPVLPS